MILENFAPIHLRVVLAHSTIDTNSSVDIFLIENNNKNLGNMKIDKKQEYNYLLLDTNVKTTNISKVKASTKKNQSPANDSP